MKYGRLVISSLKYVEQHGTYHFKDVEGLQASFKLTSDNFEMKGALVKDLRLTFNDNVVHYLPEGSDLTHCIFSDTRTYEIRASKPPVQTLEDLCAIDINRLFVYCSETVYRKLDGSVIPLTVRSLYTYFHTGIRNDESVSEKFANFLLTSSLPGVVQVISAEPKVVPYYNQEESLDYEQYDTEILIRVTPDLYEKCLATCLTTGRQYFQTSSILEYLGEAFLAKYPECAKPS